MRAKRAGNCFKLNCRERSERKIFGKFCTFPPNSRKIRLDYLFSFQKRTNYLFPAFSRSEYLFPKVPAPPPLGIKWSSPKLFIRNISDFHVTIFIIFCLKKVNCHYLSKNRRFHVINIGSEMYFHFIRFLWSELCVFFLSPSLFRFFLSHVKLVKT